MRDDNAQTDPRNRFVFFRRKADDADPAVREIDEVAADPELPARHIVRNGTIADRDDIKVLGSAIKMSGLRGDEIPPHVPDLGENTAEVLQRLGISADELDALRHNGIV